MPRAARALSQPTVNSQQSAKRPRAATLDPARLTYGVLQADPLTAAEATAAVVALVVLCWCGGQGESYRCIDTNVFQPTVPTSIYPFRHILPPPAPARKHVNMKKLLIFYSVLNFCGNYFCLLLAAHSRTVGQSSNVEKKRNKQLGRVIHVNSLAGSIYRYLHMNRLLEPNCVNIAHK